ncbi:MAG TPA: rhodanese-like domain-containing protein [Ilumatobacteraceae bacterium]|jgi:rhodanese-related sulfurtransferase
MHDRPHLKAARLTIAAIAILGVSSCGSDSGGKSESTQLAPTATTRPSTVEVVDVPKGMALVTDPSVVVLDVRTPGEFAEGHLDRAQVVDFTAADFRQQIAQFDRSATYFVYCHTGNRSSQATAIMAELGFTKIYDLSGGIRAWSLAGAPVVA